MNLGRWVSANLQEEPPSLCTEREGHQVLPWLFIRPSRVRVCLLRPPRVRAWVTGPQHIYRKSSLASARSKRAVRSSPGFLYDPRATFLFGRRGLFAETLSRASLGHGASAYLQEELRSLCLEQESHQEFPWLFVRPLRNLFVRKEEFVC